MNNEEMTEEELAIWRAAYAAYFAKIDEFSVQAAFAAVALADYAVASLRVYRKWPGNELAGIVVNEKL